MGICAGVMPRVPPPRTFNPNAPCRNSKQSLDLHDPVERAEARRRAWLHWNAKEAEREVASWFTGATYSFRVPDEAWLNTTMNGEPRFLQPPSGGSGVRRPKQP